MKTLLNFEVPLGMEIPVIRKKSYIQAGDKYL